METKLGGFASSNSSDTLSPQISVWVMVILLVIITIIIGFGFYYYKQLQNCKYYPDGWCFTDYKCHHNYSPYHETEKLKDTILELRSGNNPESIIPADWLNNGRANKK